MLEMKELKRSFFLIYADAFMVVLRYFDIYQNKDLFLDRRPYESELAGKQRQSFWQLNFGDSSRID